VRSVACCPDSNRRRISVRRPYLHRPPVVAERVQHPTTEISWTTTCRYRRGRCPAGTLSAVTERTLVLIKPDAVKRRLIGEVVSRIEAKGLTVAALELRNVGDELARKHYAEHDGKPFFDSLLEFITSGPVVAAIVEGPRAIAAFRQIAGGTDPVEKAAPGTIRGDLALVTQDNLVHGSDSPESAAREIALWFPGR
jgi:nucleoside-diphosphate kinase